MQDEQKGNDLIFQMIIIQGITFAALVLVLRKILISSSFNETKRLQRLNEESAQKTQELAGKIADAENEYREKMAKAEEEIREIRVQAKRENEEHREAAVAKAKAESDRIVAQALSARDEIRAEIEEQMEERSLALARRIFQKMLNAQEQRLIHEGLLESIFRELGEIEKARLQAANAESPPGQAQVKISYPMGPQQKERLETILSVKLGQKITVQEVADREIIAGIVIVLGSFVIDGSLLARFKKAAEGLK